MRSGDSQKGEFSKTTSPNAYSKDENRLNPQEAEPDSLEYGKQSKPLWSFHGHGARMESVTLSLWSWLVVGILCAWFCVWLAEALSHLGARLP